jgi:fatty acyl-CoA reductase
MEEMSEQDRKIFYFDVREIEWKKYFDVYVLGTRRFILKDDTSTLSIARRNLGRYYTADNNIQLSQSAFHILN